MGSWSFAALAVVILSSCASFDKSAPDTPYATIEEETFLTAMIKKDPTSEFNRYAYAIFLFNHERFEEASREEETLQRLNPKHTEGKRLQEITQKILATADVTKRHSLYDEYNAAQLRSWGPLPWSAPDDEKKFAAERKSRDKRINDRWHVSEMKQKQYQPDEREKSLTHIAVRYEQNEDAEGAERLLQQARKENPKSPFIAATWAEFLIDENRFSEADAVIEKARAEKPDEIELALLAAHVKELKAAASTEQRRSLKHEVLMDLGSLDSLLGNSWRERPY